MQGKALTWIVKMLWLNSFLSSTREKPLLFQLHISAIDLNLSDENRVVIVDLQTLKGEKISMIISH